MHPSRVSGEPPPPKSRRSSQGNFSFLEHCLFCGDVCQMEPDRRNPSRWRNAKLCRTADRGSGKTTFKYAILEVCRERSDKWSEEVQIRLQGAVSDLHAADARYHDDCRKKFMSPRSVQAAARRHTDDNDQ